MRATRARRTARRLLLAAALGILPVDRASAEAEPKTLTRTHDPIVLRTDAVAALPSRRTADLRLYRLEAGQAVAMPFQVDARNARGELQIDDAGARFDADDELVFMAVDSGDRAAGAPFPAGCGTGVEIEVRDPLTGGRGWAYLLHCPGGDAPAAAPYVTYDRATRRARSAAYDVEYADGHNYFTGMRLGTAGGQRPNLLRQTRMRGVPVLSLLVTDLQLEFTEQNAIAVVEGVRNGPVRAVRRVKLSVDLGPMFPELPNGTAYTYHYPTMYLTPTRFGIPWLALRTLRSFSFEAVADFAPAALPLRYWDGANPAGVTLTDGAPPPLVTDVDHDWWAQSGAAGSMLNAFVIPAEWREWGIARGTVVRQGVAAGVAAGYSLLNMTKLRRAGDYDMLQAAVVLPRPYEPGDEAAPMAMLTAPLQTSVRAWP
ncbi:MAG: hypothetical protein ACRERC_01550 [Candidatus Binatia bacterium]